MHPVYNLTHGHSKLLKGNNQKNAFTILKINSNTSYIFKYIFEYKNIRRNVMSCLESYVFLYLL